MDCRALPTVESPPEHSISQLGDHISLYYLEISCAQSDLVAGSFDPTSDESPGDLTIRMNMVPLLESAFANIEYFAQVYGGYGQITKLGHIGALPGRPDPSFHLRAEALDINWIAWSTGEVSRPCNGAFEALNPTSHRRLIGVEAGLRKYFGTVINRGWRGHNNHFHVDPGCPVQFNKGKETHRLFIRDCISAFTSVDDVPYNQNQWRGNIDDDTDEAALQVLLRALGMDCLDIDMNIPDYYLFLDFIMMHAFSDQRAGAYRWNGFTEL